MKFQIIKDLPLRFRLRAGAFSFSSEIGLAIEAFLEEKEFIRRVKTNPKNGSLLIDYQEGARQLVLESIQNLNVGKLTPIVSGDRYHQRQLDQKFEQALLKKIFFRYVVRHFIPYPLRHIAIWTKAFPYLKEGIDRLFHGKWTIEVLDASAIAASIYQNQYSTAGSIMFFLSISDLMENYTTERAKLELSQSLAIHVDKVWKVTEDHLESLPLEKITQGDVLRVQTGMTIPVDGTVLSGLATVDESTMTGESIPATKKEGSTVFAGTVISDGNLDVQVMEVAENTRISKIVDMIDSAESLKANIQSQAERMADKIVPYSFLTALTVYGFTRNLTRALSVLMVDYSCALKLSTPISVISALHQAAEEDVVIKGGRFLEEFAKANTLVFDKTGTLTTSTPTVTKIVAFPPYTETTLLRDAACIEEHFPHSVAKAIVNKSIEEGIVHDEYHAEVEYIVAHGIKTKLNGDTVVIGSYHFVVEDEKTFISESQQALIDQYNEGASIIYMGRDQKLAGFILIDDPIRKEAKYVLSQLADLGLDSIWMITGDGEKAARKVAEELNISNYNYQVLPDGKVEILKKIKKEKQSLIMVGDGINDSPALAEANVSVAMKDASDIAREVADIVLLGSDLEKLVYVRKLSGQVMERIHQNFKSIVGFNTMLMGMGIFGILSPSMIALLHNSSTFIIGVNSAKKYPI